MTGWKIHHEWRYIGPIKNGDFIVMLVFRGVLHMNNYIGISLIN